MADYPEAYRYTKEHEWIAVDDGVGTIGITDHAQAELGDVVYVELPAVGDAFVVGQPFGTIESVKAVSELYAPIDGEVVEVHGDLVDKPELVNEDPHGAAWMVKVKLSDPAAVEALLSAADYQALLDASH
jgi:glycine cleavage system H protein